MQDREKNHRYPTWKYFEKKASLRKKYFRTSPYQLRVEIDPGQHFNLLFRVLDDIPDIHNKLKILLLTGIPCSYTR